MSNLSREKFRWLLAGGLAGLVNGFFGGGGGSVLVPLLTQLCKLDQRRAFATSVAVILPLCPDKGSSMTYDLSRGASTYLDDDIELLKRMRFMTKEAKI